MNYDPGQTKMRLGWEATPGRKPTAFPWDMDFTTESLGMTRSRIDLATIVGSGQMPESLLGKIAADGDAGTEFNVEGHMPFVTSLQRAYSVSSPAAGVQVGTFAPSASTAAPDTFAIELDRDDGIPMVLSGNRVGQAQFSLGANSVLTAQWSIMGESGDYFESATTLTDPAPNADQPVLRGLLSAAQEEAVAGEEVFVKVADIGGLPASLTVLAKVGSGAYSTVESTIQVGTDDRGRPRWSRLFDSTTGALLGAAQLELSIIDSTDYAVDDEWRWDRVRGVWAPSLPAVKPFSEVRAAVLMDGAVVKYVNTLGISIGNAVALKQYVGGPWNVPKQAGRRPVTWTLSRDHFSPYIQRRMLDGTPIKLEVDARTGIQFETGYEHGCKIVSPRLLATGKTIGTSSETDRTEDITFTAHPYIADPEGYVDDITFETTTSIANPAA